MGTTNAAADLDGRDGGVDDGGGRQFDRGPAQRVRGVRRVLQVLQERLPVWGFVHQLRGHLPRGQRLRVQWGRPGSVKVAALVGALLVAGCDGGESAMGPPDGTGGAGGQAGQAGASATGGQAALGTGGAPAAGGEIGTTFTSADHDMCIDWPLCPSGVFSPLTSSGRVKNPLCPKAQDGGSLYCAACINVSSCERFVGRCRAPYLDAAASNHVFWASALTGESCRAFLDLAPTVVSGGWALCTGDLDSRVPDGVGINARTVCGE